MAKKKKGALVVDFAGVELSGKHPVGSFVFVIDGTPEIRNSATSGNDYLNIKLKSEKGTVYYTASLASHALWNLKNLLLCAGQDVPDGEMQLDLDELDGLNVGAEIIQEKYEGKLRSVVGDLFNPDDAEGAEEEEEGDDDVTYEAVQEMELDELLELAKENDIKVTKKQQKDLDGLRDTLCEALDLEEGEEEEGDDDVTYEAVQEMDEDDLDELCEEHDIKVKAKDKKKIAKYRDAVCEALDLEEEEEEEEEEPQKGKGKGTSKKK